MRGTSNSILILACLAAFAALLKLLPGAAEPAPDAFSLIDVLRGLADGLIWLAERLQALGVR
ncbi:MAG: hypothetical protein RQ729_07435 [Wenzhouxiangellaceae bacterium]|nr:hypothetical protein [Wenzhouxiangellaceae bacterium]